MARLNFDKLNSKSRANKNYWKHKAAQAHKKAVAKKKQKRLPIEQLARKLRKRQPKSELWFWKRYSELIIQENVTLYRDLSNEPFHGMIPDVLNRGWKYVIEIDGSIHFSPYQRFKDNQKDAKYRSLGYKVFRIPHGNNEMLDRVLSEIIEIRKTNPIKFKPKALPSGWD